LVIVPVVELGTRNATCNRGAKAKRRGDEITWEAP
jgi:hypothetical protein